MSSDVDPWAELARKLEAGLDVRPDLSVLQSRGIVHLLEESGFPAAAAEFPRNPPAALALLDNATLLSLNAASLSLCRSAFGARRSLDALSHNQVAEWERGLVLHYAGAGDWRYVAHYIEEGGEIDGEMRKFLAAVLRGKKRPNNKPPRSAHLFAA
jgi:hypothetical protein